MKQLIVLFALCTSIAFAQGRDFSKVEMKVQKVAGNVYMLQGAGGNIGVSVGDDGVLVIDDEYAPLAPKIKAAILLARAWSTGSRLAIFFGTDTCADLRGLARAAAPRRTCAAVMQAPRRSAARPARHS